MYNFKFTHKGKDTTINSIPQTWEEFTVDQMIRLESIPFEGDYIKLLHILSGIDLKELYEYTGDLSGQIRKSLKFIGTEPPIWKDLPLSKTFKYMGAEYDIPKDIEFEMMGQKMLITQALNNNSATAVIPYAVAVYMQPIIDKSYDETKIEALEKEILQMPAVEIFPLASFFFQMLKESKQFGIKNFSLSLLQRIS